MKNLLKHKKTLLFLFIISLFFINNITGTLMALAVISFILITNRKFARLVLNWGFLVFLAIVLSVPVMFDFTINNLFNNTLLVSRGVLIIFLIVFILQDMPSNKYYLKIERYLPEELVNTIKIAVTILPEICNKLTKEYKNIGNNLQNIFETFVNIAEELAVKLEKQIRPKVYIITGDVHSGKTTYAFKIARKIKKKGIKIAGILAPGYMKEGKRIAFDVLDLATVEKTRLATSKNIEDLKEVFGEYFGPYYFYRSGMNFARNALKLETVKNSYVVFIDEVGRMEIQESGYYQALIDLLESDINTIILVVREKFIEDIKKKFNINPAGILRVEKQIYKSSELLNENVICSISS